MVTFFGDGALDADNGGDENKWGEGCCPNCGGIEAGWLGRYKGKDNIWRNDYECHDCGQHFSEQDLVATE